MIERPLDPPVPRRGEPGVAPRNTYVPLRCQRSPNASYDRTFGMYLCEQRDPRCRFHGPAYVLDQDGRHYECRARESEGSQAPR